ncbi:MAG: hypothetical protein IKQ22_06260 [Clostridia bacterium]|nr:hypothetical protein [Clostridia bacterium]
MDPNKAYEIGRQGDEQRFRSLIQDALSEGNEAIVSWLLDKVKAAHTGSFKDIIEEAVTNANTESETYKPTDLAKKYWNEYFPEAEPQFEEPETSGVKDDDYEDYTTPEQIQDLEKEFGTQGDNSDTGTPYQSREDVPESARDLWDIMHNDEAINSMRRGM